MHACIHTYIHTHIYIYMCMYIYMYMCMHLGMTLTTYNYRQMIWLFQSGVSRTREINTDPAEAESSFVDPLRSSPPFSEAQSIFLLYVYHTHTKTWTSIYIYTYVYIYVYALCVYLYRHMRTCSPGWALNAGMRPVTLNLKHQLMPIHVCMCIFTDIHTYIHTYIHTNCVYIKFS